MLVAWIDQTSKPSDMRIILAIDANNQNVADTMWGANNWKIFVDEVEFVLESDEVCANILQ